MEDKKWFIIKFTNGEEYSIYGKKCGYHPHIIIDENESKFIYNFDNVNAVISMSQENYEKYVSHINGGIDERIAELVRHEHEKAKKTAHQVHTDD